MTAHFSLGLQEKAKEKELERQREKPRWYYLPSKHSGTSADLHSTQCSGTHTHTLTSTRTCTHTGWTSRRWTASWRSYMQIHMSGLLRSRVFWHANGPDRRHWINNIKSTDCNWCNWCLWVFGLSLESLFYTGQKPTDCLQCEWHSLSSQMSPQ